VQSGLQDELKTAHSRLEECETNCELLQNREVQLTQNLAALQATKVSLEMGLVLLTDNILALKL
jgi:hypothetical protein